jgi:hypothetical protein
MVSECIAGVKGISRNTMITVKFEGSQVVKASVILDCE